VRPVGPRDGLACTAPAKRARRAPPERTSIATLCNPVLGDLGAPVTLVEFTDYQCPFCTRFCQNTLRRI
jgi:protein-disulfide isomerase